MGHLEQHDQNIGLVSFIFISSFSPSSLLYGFGENNEYRIEFVCHTTLVLLISVASVRIIFFFFCNLLADCL